MLQEPAADERLPVTTGILRCVQGFGENGRLGYGSNATAATPVAVAGGHTFTSLAAGHAHACGLTADGQAWCCKSWHVHTCCPAPTGAVCCHVQRVLHRSAGLATQQIRAALPCGLQGEMVSSAS